MKLKIRQSEERDLELSASIFELANLYQATRRGGRRSKEQKDALEALGDLFLEDDEVKKIVEAAAAEEEEGEE